MNEVIKLTSVIEIPISSERKTAQKLKGEGGGRRLHAAVSEIL